MISKWWSHKYNNYFNTQLNNNRYKLDKISDIQGFVTVILLIKLKSILIILYKQKIEILKHSIIILCKFSN